MKEPIVALCPAGLMHPFCDYAKRAGLDITSLLTDANIPLATLRDPGLPIAVQAFYDVVAGMADKLQDPYFGYRVGSETAFEKMPNLRTHTRQKQLLCVILCGLLQDIGRVANYAKYSLLVESEHTILRMKRQFRPQQAPAQIDAHGLGFMIRLYEYAVGRQWDPQQFRATLCDLTVLPPHVLPTSSLRQGDDSGVEHVFPTNWLYLNEPHQISFDGGHYLQSSLVDVVRTYLQANLSDPNLTCEKLALLCGKSARTIRRALAGRETTFVKELARVRQSAAEQALANTDRSVRDIARQVGFQHPESFSRSFRHWTGQSPAAYRETARQRRC